MTTYMKEKQPYVTSKCLFFCRASFKPKLDLIQALLLTIPKDICHNLEIAQCTQKPIARFCPMGILLILFIQLTLIKLFYNYNRWHCLTYTIHQVNRLYVNFSLHKHQAHIRPLFDLYNALKHLDSNELANKSLVILSLQPI